jgi:hypothetical protein
MRCCFRVLCALAFVLSVRAFPAHAQEMREKGEPARHLITIYQVAPGKHIEFLKWIAEREAISREAGGTTPHWFAHLDGASWDFIAIGDAEESDEAEAEGERIEAAMKARGLTTGAAQAMEFRQFISSHTDTYAMGPFTAEEILKEVQGQ